MAYLNPTVHCLQETLYIQDTKRLKAKKKKERKKVYHISSNHRKARMTILIGKIDFKMKNLTAVKKEHFIMMKTLFYQEDITITNIYAANNRIPKYVK